MIIPRVHIFPYIDYLLGLNPYFEDLHHKNSSLSMKSYSYSKFFPHIFSVENSVISKPFKSLHLDYKVALNKHSHHYSHNNKYRFSAHNYFAKKHSPVYVRQK